MPIMWMNWMNLPPQEGLYCSNYQNYLRRTIMKNGQQWKDIHGNYIQAHGGCILKYNGIYYWYGEHKGADNCPNSRRVDVIGVSCYISKNLVDWEYKGLVLEAVKDNPESYLHPSKVLERPKVIYNAKTQKFVMWMHMDSADYKLASAGIAIADNPEGPFKLLKVKRPNNQELRDMTLYKDVDDIAYLIYSTDHNNTISIDKLTEDYTDLEGSSTFAMVNQMREAAAVCFHGNKYYMVTSGCTGWKPNSTLYSTSDHIMGSWKLIDNPCEGENYRITFYGQSTYIFEADNRLFLILDHWNANDLKCSGYSILPIEFDEDGIMHINWCSDWDGI